MSPSPQAIALNACSLSSLATRFRALPLPAVTALTGIYRAELVGPAWLRRAAGPALALGGLGGWWGKEFLRDGRGLNLVLRGGRFSRIFPFELVQARSLLEDGPARLIRYARECPFPWPFIVDELRQFDPGWLWGMTLIAGGGFPRIPFPFLLHYEEHVDGL